MYLIQTNKTQLPASCLPLTQDFCNLLPKDCPATWTIFFYYYYFFAHLAVKCTWRNQKYVKDFHRAPFLLNIHSYTTDYAKYDRYNYTLGEKNIQESPSTESRDTHPRQVTVTCHNLDSCQWKSQEIKLGPVKACLVLCWLWTGDHLWIKLKFVPQSLGPLL